MSTEFEKALKHIKSTEPIQPGLLYGLSTISKPDFELFQQAWPNIETAQRETIMGHLAEITEYNFEVNFEPIFIFGLDDSSNEVQVKAIEGLWESGNPALIPPLIHLMKTGGSVAVRTAAAQSLGQFIYLGEVEEIAEEAYAVAVQALLETIRNAAEDVEVIRRAIEAVSFCGDEGIPQIIESAYYHDDERMRISSVFAMGRHGHSELWGNIVIDELSNNEPQMRFEAVRAAGELNLKAAVEKLVNIVEVEADSEIQQSAVWSLGQIGGDQAQALLEDLLQREDTDEALYTATEEALDELMLWNSQDMEDFFSYAIGGDDEDDLHIIDLNGKDESTLN